MDKPDWKQEPLTVMQISNLRGQSTTDVEADLLLELSEWRKCAVYKLGKFQRWNQKALNRCRKRFLEASATKEK